MLGTLFLDPRMRVLGSTPTILPYARDYARYILFGAPVMCASFVLNNILRGEGKAMLAMVGIGLGGVLNIGLDPLFIYTFGLGIAGAAIATLLSQCVSFAILLALSLIHIWLQLAFTSSRAAPPISRARWEGQGSGFWREMLFRSGFLMSTCTAAA